MARIFIVLLLGLLGASAARAQMPSAAFYYGPNIPWRQLAVFDMAVVEPDQAVSPPAGQLGKVYAYVSLGEMQPSRPYVAGLKSAWRLGKNQDWHSIVLDLANPALRDYLIDKVVRPLWKKGYRHFFFDTLDSYQLAVGSDAGREAQRKGLETLINRIAATFPGASFILNRGFELLPAVHDHVDAVAAESLYQRWVPAEQRYQAVSEGDRHWLLERFHEVRARYGIPAIAIDYAPPSDRDQARSLAAKISADGVIPWVTDPALDMMGVGNIEVMPRRVLMIHDTSGAGLWESSELVRYALMPLQFLGLVPDIRYVGDSMPGGNLKGRYAGIVTWLNSDQVPPGFQSWLARQAANGVPVAMLGHLAIDAQGAHAAQFGLQSVVPPNSPPRIVQRAKPMGFEAPLPGLLDVGQPVTLTQFQVVVTYIIACSLILTGTLQLAFTRFCADRIFEKRDPVVLPNFGGVTLLVTVVSGVLSLLAALFLFPEQTVLFRMTLVASFVVVSNIWIATIFLSGMKQYRAIVFLYGVGYALTVAAAVALRSLNLDGLLLGFLIGQVVLLSGMLVLILRGYPSHQAVAFDFFQRRYLYPSLMLVGLFFNAGVWADKIIFWLDPATGTTVIGPLRASLIYDIPVFLSYLSLIPGMAIFLVRMETDFVEYYTNFYDAVRTGGSLSYIEDMRNQMVSTIRVGVFQIIKIQALAALLLMTAAPGIFQALGISSLYLPLLKVQLVAAALQVVFLAIINVFCYLDQRRLLVLITGLFLVLNVALTLLSLHLGPQFFGFGFLLALAISVLLGLWLVDRVMGRLEYQTFMLH